MDCPLPVVSDDGDLPWSDNPSMDSDDDQSMDFDDHNHGWMGIFAACSAPEPLSAAPVTASASHMTHAGQLSPISTGMDVNMSGDGCSSGSCPSSATTAPAMVHSASSSSCAADSWSMHGFGDSDDHSGGDGHNDVHWEQGSDDVLTAPKLEPMDDDDDFCMDAVKEAPMTPVPNTAAPAPLEGKVKRPRGRPRKHPVAPILNASKVTKGRSKTGCLTCRKRKKKCDEAKPRCMNCEKNSVVCEGYPEKNIWKSGREKQAEQTLLNTQALPIITMPPIFEAVETPEDRIFFKHYNDHLSSVLTVEGEHKNAFKEMLIPIATKHRGLMHSILSLSGTHLDYDTPYAINLLKKAKYPLANIAALRERSAYHHEKAMSSLKSLTIESQEDNPDSGLALSALYGQMLCLVLENVAEGAGDGQHRHHLKAYQELIRTSPPQDPQFLTFITEFFQYHIFADELIRFPGNGRSTRGVHANEHNNEHDGNRKNREPPRLAEENWSPPPGVEIPLHPARLLGVADGLFNHLCEITTIRNRIRANMDAQADPVVDYTSLYQAAEIDEAIREWTPHWPRGDSRDRVGLLYKQMMWVYLYRTIYPPSSGSCSSSLPSASCAESASSSTAGSLASTTAATMTTSTSILGGGDFAIVHTPPHSASTSCLSSPQLRPNSAGATGEVQFDLHLQEHHQQPAPHSPRRHSIAHPHPFFSSSSSAAGGSQLPTPRKSATFSVASSYDDLSCSSAAQQHQQQQLPRAESPPPIRHPPHQDPRITLAVEQSLAILDSFKPSDPAQTLLLIPCLVIGAACFSPNQQARVRTALRSVRGYTGLRNADRVAEVLDELWRLMALGDWIAVWDWQRVAAEHLKLDFLCA